MKKCVGINLGAVVAQTQRNRVVPEVHDKSDGVYSVAFSDPKFLRVEFHMRDEVLLDCHGRPMDPLAGIKLPVVANALALPLGTRFLFGDTRLAPEVGNQTDELIFEIKTPEKANNIFALVKQKTTGEEYEAATWSKTRDIPYTQTLTLYIRLLPHTVAHTGKGISFPLAKPRGYVILACVPWRKTPSSQSKLFVMRPTEIIVMQIIACTSTLLLCFQRSISRWLQLQKRPDTKASILSRCSLTATCHSSYVMGGSTMEKKTLGDTLII